MSVFVLRGLTGDGAMALEMGGFGRAAGAGDLGATTRAGLGFAAAMLGWGALTAGGSMATATADGAADAGWTLGAGGVGGVTVARCALGDALGGGTTSLVGRTLWSRPRNSAAPASSATSATAPPTSQRLRGERDNAGSSGSSVCAARP